MPTKDKELVTDKLAYPLGLAISADKAIAYVCAGNNDIVRVNLKGAPDPKSVVQGIGTAHTIALDGQGHAYTPVFDGSVVYKSDLTTGNKSVFISNLPGSRGVAMSPAKDAVYVLSVSGVLSQFDTSGKLVKTFDKATGGQYHSVTVGIEGFAYVVKEYHEIVRIDLSNDTRTTLADGFSTLYDLALDGGGSLYAPDADTGVLWRITLKTGAKEKAAEGLGTTHGMATDGNDAYVTDEGGKLYRVPGSIKPLPPAEIPATLTGPQQAATGSPVEFTATVENKGPNPANDVTLKGAFDAHIKNVEIASVTPHGGATYGTAKQGNSFEQPLKLPVNSGAEIKITGTTDAQYEGNVTDTVSVVTVGVINTSKTPTAKVVTSVQKILAPPAITEPKDGAVLTDPRQPVKGTVAEADQVTLTDRGKDLGPAHLTGTTWSYTPGQDWAVGSHEIKAVAHKGGRVSAAATLHFTAPDPNLVVTQKLLGHWQKSSGHYIYSFELTIAASKHRIDKGWTVSFAVDKGVILDPDWAKGFTWHIAKDGSDGTVVIQNVDLTKTIDPGTPLNIDIQLLCPGQSTSYENLRNLTGHEGL
ncbi:DUF11 domain-containing protein [Streptomyces sp. I05A-00742]|uniref:DUF11 domain-containing protein n=1 Tax=Streptomyces sp. I05A-00742 TaxID=2732853 RepID=UPI0014880651|nr:DUF11 domain-containing protein [Streptomyces sp. I05A-00742]